MTDIRNAEHTVTVRPDSGPDYRLTYDILVVTAGAVTRTVAIPGLSEEAFGLKHVEEAVAIRDRLLTSFDRAASLPRGPERRKLLTIMFVGGGFSGVEGLGELLSLATALLDHYPELTPEELRFHLVEACGRIVPEVGDRPGAHTVPNAQHAVRQGKRLAKDILATLRGRTAKDYVHRSLGVVATPGLGRGIFQYRRLVIKGFPAWLMHRGYHVLAVPTWERKVRVLAVWATSAPYGRDLVSLASVQQPREAFVSHGNPRRGDQTADVPAQ